MKRIIAILLTVLLLGMLTACDQNVGRHADGIIKADKATFEIGKTHSSFEGMKITPIHIVLCVRQVMEELLQPFSKLTRMHSIGNTHKLVIFQ